MVNVMVIGSGGREHALATYLRWSPFRNEVYAVPGNPGMAELGFTCLPISVNDLDGIVTAVRERWIDLAVIGPEAPLVAGLADRLRQANIPTFGPSADASQIEASKSYARRLMTRMGVPQPGYAACTTMEQVEISCRGLMSDTGECNVVVKANGLAAGKGAIVCSRIEEALAAAQAMLIDHQFGEAGEIVLVEQRLFGEEVSLFILTDGQVAVPLPPAQDYKRAYDGNEGPNTGGMGAYAPAPIMTPALTEWTMQHIVRPTLKGMKAEGSPFQGCLYVGLMVVDDNEERPDIRVLEYNCRFGDPETQVVLPLLNEDLLPVMLSVAKGTLADRPLRWKNAYATTVVLASEGYPGSYETGRPITGIEAVGNLEGVMIFHAGTRRSETGILVTNGGRVLDVTGIGSDFAASTARAYAGVHAVHFGGMQFRHDIAQRVINT